MPNLDITQLRGLVASNAELELGEPLESGYVEVTRDGNNQVSVQTVYDTPAKVNILQDITYTRTANQVTSIVTRVYDNDTFALRYTTTITITRSGAAFSSETRVKVGDL